MKMQELKARLAACRRQTAGAAALRILKGALHRWVQWGTLVFLEHDLETTPPVRERGDHEIREVTDADLPALASLGRDPADLARRLARGDRAFAFFEAGSGEPLHFRWGTTQPTWIPEIGSWLHPRPNEFYLYDVITHPLHRGRRIPDLVRAVMDESFARRGFHTKIGYVRADNHAMLRSVQRVRVPVRELFRISYVRWTRHEPLVLGPLQTPLSRDPDGLPEVLTLALK